MRANYGHQRQEQIDEPCSGHHQLAGDVRWSWTSAQRDHSGVLPERLLHHLHARARHARVTRARRPRGTIARVTRARCPRGTMRARHPRGAARGCMHNPSSWRRTPLPYYYISLLVFRRFREWSLALRDSRAYGWRSSPCPVPFSTRSPECTRHSCVCERHRATAYEDIVVGQKSSQQTRQKEWHGVVTRVRIFRPDARHLDALLLHTCRCNVTVFYVLHRFAPFD